MRFKGIINEIAFQRTLLMDELGLLQLQQSADSGVEANRERKMAEIERRLTEHARQKIDRIDAATTQVATHLESRAYCM